MSKAKLITLEDIVFDYYAFPDGRIYDDKRGLFVTSHEDENGYLRVSLRTFYKTRKTISVHQAILRTFAGDPPLDMEDPTVHHIDGDVKNNSISNLVWLERSLNSALRDMLMRGDYHGGSKLTQCQVEEICNLLVENRLTYKQIGDIYGVAATTISKIKNRNTWTHVSKNYIFPKR